MKTIYAILLLMGTMISLNATSQTSGSDSTSSSKLYAILKNDGTQYIGKIISDDGREVLIETETLGKIYIPKSDIKSMILIEDKRDIVYGDFRNEGPFTTRYAFTTNALPIKKGENYALVNLYGPEVHFAVSDKLNVGVMSTWIASPMVLALKYSMKTQNEKVNFSIGTLMGTSGYLRNFRGFGGLHFANVTFGDRKNNLTLAAGYGYLQTGRYAYGPTEEAVVYDNGNYYSSYNQSNSKMPMTKGLIFSVAGIAAVGAKASFVFDSMLGIMNTNAYSTTTTEITPASYDTYGNYVPGYYRHDTKLVEKQSIAMFIMPGMRFQKSEDRAFQVSLAGVSLFRTKGWNYGNGTSSFPFPMCSWFFKF